MKKRSTNLTFYQIPQNIEDYLVGRSVYYTLASFHDQMFLLVNILAQRINKPTQQDWNEFKRIVRYLKDTVNFKLKLGNARADTPIIGYADANWAECKQDCKSNSGYIFFVFGGAISWCCRKQSCVALSSMEAEYISLCKAGQEAIWLRLLKDFNIDVKTSTIIYEDNQSCLKFGEEERLSNRTKHIDTKKYFIQHYIQKGEVSCLYCPS